METIALTAPDISCDHCKATIEREVSTIQGVQRAQVDVPSRRVEVTFDPMHTSREAIVALLDEEGYPISE
jgi:copper chaperone